MALVATLYNNPACSATGISFNGVDQYAHITSWSWGGATSFEVYFTYAAYPVFNDDAVIDFSSGAELNSARLGYSISAVKTVYFGGIAIFYFIGINV